MRSILTAVFISLLSLPARAEAPEDQHCFDVAVVARLVRATPGPFPDLGPDVIVLRWPWVLEFETEEVIIGREDRPRFHVTTSLHANFNPQIKRFLLFLRHDPNRGYVAADIAIDVVRDRRGRLVIPFEGPIEDVRPESWIPASYEGYLRPIRYRASDAWWLGEPHMDDEDLADIPPGWHTRTNGHVVALRGLYLSDLERMMAGEPGAMCAT